jgi:hypothetical protein
MQNLQESGTCITSMTMCRNASTVGGQHIKSAPLGTRECGPQDQAELDDKDPASRKGPYDLASRQRFEGCLTPCGMRFPCLRRGRVHACSQDGDKVVPALIGMSSTARTSAFEELPTMIGPGDICMHRPVSTVKIDHRAIGLRTLMDKTHHRFFRANHNPLFWNNLWSCCQNIFSFVTGSSFMCNILYCQSFFRNTGHLRFLPGTSHVQILDLPLFSRWNKLCALPSSNVTLPLLPAPGIHENFSSDRLHYRSHGNSSTPGNPAPRPHN